MIEADPYLRATSFFVGCFWNEMSRSENDLTDGAICGVTIGTMRYSPRISFKRSVPITYLSKNLPDGSEYTVVTNAESVDRAI